MAHSVTITGPVPTLEEFGKNLGLSKKEQKQLLQIIYGTAKPRVVAERRDDAAVRAEKTPKASGRSEK